MKPIRLHIDDERYRKIIRGGYGTDLTPNVGDPPPARNEVDVFVATGYILPHPTNQPLIDA